MNESDNLKYRANIEKALLSDSETTTITMYGEIYWHNSGFTS